jgi:hypothetical protein
MTDNSHNARVANDAAKALTSVPLRIRLVIGGIFIAGIVMVLLP